MASCLVLQSKKRGDEFYRHGHYAAGAKEFTLAIDYSEFEQSSNRHLYYSNRCACYMQLGNYSSASNDALSCISLNPTFVKGHSRLAACYIKLNDFEAARRTFKRVLELDPSNIDALRFMKFHQKPNALRSIWNFVTSRTASYLSRSLPFVKANLNTILIGIAILCVSYYLKSSAEIHTHHNEFVKPNFHQYSRYSYRSYGGSSWGSNGGLLLLLLLCAGYILPPTLPGLLGPQHAQPFFGMSITTVLSLLSLFVPGWPGPRVAFFNFGPFQNNFGPFQNNFRPFQNNFNRRW